MKQKVKLTGKQCQQARALLKWNISDLIRHTNVRMERIRAFEKGLNHLQKWENDETVTAFLKHNVEFRDYFEVALNDKVADSKAPAILTHGEVEVIKITDEMMEELTKEKKKKKKKQDK